MSRLSGSTAAVVGAGAFGLACALRLQDEGARVVVYDPQPVGDSASGVAAGMLAPGLEALLDPVSSGHFAWLDAASARWTGLLALAEADPTLIDRSGALFLPDDGADAEAAAARLAREGAPFERLSAAQARDLAPGLAGLVETALFLPGEARLAPPATLQALAQALRRRGGRLERRRVVVEDGALRTVEGEAVEADHLVLASGAETSGLDELAPALARLEPIKGQILHYAGGPSGGPVIRTPRAYVAPQPEGPVVGATMEAGVSDRTTDPAVLARLRQEAERLFPSLAHRASEGRAGVRASAPDGLPLVGRSQGGRAILAAGARRNGWLLAPLVAEIVVCLAAGGDGGEFGRRFSPDRFAG